MGNSNKLDKSSVKVYVEGLAKEKNLSSNQKGELEKALKEATSILNDDKERIEEALTFLDNRIQSSPGIFFTSSGINVNEMKTTTMFKVKEIHKDIIHQKNIQEAAEERAQKNNDMINSYFDKAQNLEINEADLFKFPEKEVIASIRESVTTYFDGEDLSKEFLEELSKNIFDAKKIDLEIEARIAAGEKREDVEAEVFQDESSRLKNAASVKISDEVEEEKYFENSNAIEKFSVEQGLEFDEAAKKYFKGKPEIEYFKFMIEHQKERARIREVMQEEADRKQNGVLKKKKSTKFSKIEEYIEHEEKEIQTYQQKIAELRKQGKESECMALEKECKKKQVRIVEYQKVLDTSRGKSSKRERKRIENVQFYKENEGKVNEYVKQRLYY